MKPFLFMLIVASFFLLVKDRMTGLFYWQNHAYGDGHSPQRYVSSTSTDRQWSSFILAMAKTEGPKDTGTGSAEVNSTKSEVNSLKSYGEIKLPKPDEQGVISVEEAISRRRTERRFLSTPISLKQISQILWAGQGITGEVSISKRAVASAGALYPLDIFLIVGGETDGQEDTDGQLSAGVYQYLPYDHKLRRTNHEDLRSKVARASLGQTWISHAPVSIVITADYERTTPKYGQRGIRYVHMEVGHAAQNIFLQAVALNLGAGIVGAFSDAELKSILKLPANLDPLLIMPIGRVKN